MKLPTSPPFSNRGAMQLESASYDRYWRLNNYCKRTKREFLSNFRAHRYKVPISAKREVMVATQHRLDCEMICYYHPSISVEELTRFIKGRGLNMPGSKTRKSLAAVLYEADKRINFTKLADLPAEVRTLIYTYYVRGFPAALKFPTQPPLARLSKQMRQEVLPVFFHEATFHLTFWLLACKLRPSYETEAFISSIPSHLDGCIRHVLINVEVPCRTHPLISLKIDLSTNGKFHKHQIIRGSSSGGNALVPLKDAVKRTLDEICGEGGSRALRLDDIFHIRKALEQNMP